MTGLVRSRLVALDTAQLVNWSSDYSSSNRTRRSSAIQFSKTLLDNGVIVLICQHHLVELLQIADDDLARSRLQFLQTLPVVAWLASASGSDVVGSIADLFAHEIRAALDVKEPTLFSVRDKVAINIFKFGAGRAFREYGQDPPERKGSDLTDGYLASLSPYADITFVDKRTNENLRRAVQKNPVLGRLIRRVEAVTDYDGVKRCLSI